ncbi:2-oxo-4-hydroxy-4-carboxy-5-ureidoimidazoline decarboxylase [Streptomyces sodiiphilus]|uniref:2-oxo-4-hydroxy-4-carboxy-5-ureidoimidazoline decarboxylase n=1 Tax=Streptomyces sodiiphilus TaxID=226217 RepID=A0ABP5A807_9ACTN
MRLPAQRHAAAPLERVNTAPRQVAEAALLSCCGSSRWARRLADHRPYRDVDTLLAAGDEASYDLSPGDVDEALAAEETVRPPAYPGGGPGRPAARTALLAARAEYRRRFGHPFVLCLDDCHPEEWLDRTLTALRTRLGHEPYTEREHAAEELRLLARGRLARLAGSAPHPSGAPRPLLRQWGGVHA